MNDRSLFTLLGMNVLTLVCAVVFQWSLAQVLLVYWMQSVGIGLVNVFRILHADVSVEVHKSVTVLARIFYAGFFSFHYGLFHLGYGIFIFVFGARMTWSVFLFGILFLMQHAYSFFIHRKEKRDLAQTFKDPYVRIFPMHIMIIFGFILPGFLGMMFFMVLKTIADVMMHRREHASAGSFKAPHRSRPKHF